MSNHVQASKTTASWPVFGQDSEDGYWDIVGGDCVVFIPYHIFRNKPPEDAADKPGDKLDSVEKVR